MDNSIMFQVLFQYLLTIEIYGVILNKKFANLGKFKILRYLDIGNFDGEQNNFWKKLLRFVLFSYPTNQLA